MQARAVPGQHDVSQRSQHIEEDALDEVESLLIRMLTGAIKFPFVTLPLWLCRTFQYLFPTAIRILRIALLAGLLAAIVAGPAAYAFFFNSINDWIAQYMSPSLTAALRNHPAMTHTLCYTWSSVSAIGAIWGAMYVRRKRKRLRQERIIKL